MVEKSLVKATKERKEEERKRETEKYKIEEKQ